MPIRGFVVDELLNVFTTQESRCQSPTGGRMFHNLMSLCRPGVPGSLCCLTQWGTTPFHGPFPCAPSDFKGALSRGIFSTQSLDLETICLYGGSSCLPGKMSGPGSKFGERPESNGRFYKTTGWGLACFSGRWELKSTRMLENAQTWNHYCTLIDCR